VAWIKAAVDWDCRKCCRS